MDYTSHGLDPTLPVAKYWEKLFFTTNRAGALLFGELKKVIRLLLVLPFSYASVERVFSAINNIDCTLKLVEYRNLDIIDGN